MEEVADGRWWDIDEVMQALAERPQEFAVWFRLAAPRVVDLLQRANGAIIN